MQRIAVTAGVVALVSMASVPAEADTFTVDHACPAYASIRKGTNPGAVTVAPHTTYDVVARNKPDATHYRIKIEGAEPDLRWVSAECGTISETAPANPPAQAGGVR